MDTGPSNNDLPNDGGADVSAEAASAPAPAAAPAPQPKGPAPGAPFEMPKITMLTDNYLEMAVEEEQAPRKKKKRMTKQERKEKKRQQMIADTKLIMRDHIKREVELSKKTASHFQDNWEELVKSIKIVEMRDELQAWGQKINRQVHTQDEMVKTMMQDIDSTMELSTKSYQQYCESVDFVHDTYKVCIDGVKNCYESEASDIVKNFQEGVRAAQKHLEEQKLNFEKKINALAFKGEKALEIDHEIFLVKKRNIFEDNIVRRYEVRDAVVNKMKILQRKLQDFIAEITSSVENDKYEKINGLIEKHIQFRQDKQKIDKMEMQKLNELHILQKEFMKLELKTTNKLSNLHQEYKYFSEMRKGLLDIMEEERVGVFNKLKTITSKSEVLIKKFKEIVKDGELLLSLSALCRKMQTQSEKIVFPARDTSYFVRPERLRVFPECVTLSLFSSDTKTSTSSSSLAEDIFRLRTLSLKEHVDMTEKEVAEQIKLFEMFWRRQALVEAQVIMLKNEKDRLTKENQHHIDFIKSLGYTDDLDKLREFLKVKVVLDSPTSCSFG